MIQISIIAVLIFCAVLLAVQGAYWFFSERQRSREAINRRLVLAKQNVNAQEVFETLKRERGLAGLGNPHFAHLNELIVQTGVRLDERVLVGGAFLLGVFFLVVFGFGLGYGFISLILATISSLFSVILFLVLLRRKRIARFSDQLPDAIDVIVRGVKSGYPFPVALALVGKEMPDPVGTEFGMTSDELNFGSDVGTVLDNLYHRVGHEDLLYLTMAIKIQTETGGNLAEILTRLARLIRERAMLRLKVKAITAEGRLSAVFLSAFPFVIFAIVSLMSPDYYGGVANHPAMIPAVIIGLILMIVGNVIIYRMVNFKV